MATTDQTYYGTAALHGNYQYVSAKEILDAMEIESQDDDSYIKNVPRYKLLYHLRQGISEISKDTANDVLAFEAKVPTSLVWTMPPDFRNYAAAYVVVTEAQSGAKRLMPLNVNTDINIAKAFVQDGSDALTFDGAGKVITADISNAYAIPYQTYQIVGAGTCDGLYTDYSGYIDTAKLAEWGEVVFDKRRGKILFSSALSGERVVIKYLSDGLQADLTDSEITVHKNIKQCLKDWIYAEAIRMKRNVPQSERVYARNRFLKSLHEASVNTLDLNIFEVSRAMRTKSMKP